MESTDRIRFIYIHTKIGTKDRDSQTDMTKIDKMSARTLKCAHDYNKFFSYILHSEIKFKKNPLFSL